MKSIAKLRAVENKNKTIVKEGQIETVQMKIRSNQSKVGERRRNGKRSNEDEIKPGQFDK